MFEKKVWAVVANGSRARILKNIGHSSGSDTVDLQAEHPPLGEIMADRAGRSFASVGGGRSGMELKSDPVRDNERAFADRLAAMLEYHRLADEIDALVVVAAPRALGDLRRAFSAQLQKKIIVESNKDLTALPTKSLYEAVDKLRST